MKTGKVVIPARMESERLPRKMMIDILGRPMIEHVWRRARLVLSNEDVVVATDSDLIESHMKSLGAQIYRSKKAHQTGSSRVCEYLEEFSLDFAVVLQGDEVLVQPGAIHALYEKMATGQDSFINVVSPLTNIEDLNSVDVVKCWIDSKSQIRFIFRGNPLRNPLDNHSFIKIVSGLFAISRSTLSNLTKAPNGIGSAESIEQLQLLDLGVEIIPYEVDSYYPSINTYSDLRKALGILSEIRNQKNIMDKIFKL